MAACTGGHFYFCSWGGESMTRNRFAFFIYMARKNPRYMGFFVEMGRKHPVWD